MLKLNFHHHIILVRCNESLLLQKLEQEFHFFVSHDEMPPDVEINLLKEAPPEMPPMVAVKLLENAAVYRLGSRQYIDYFGEALTIWDTQDGKVEIFSENQDRLYELSFLAIHSLLGQELDRDGIVRLHAVAISLGNINGIIMLPSKGGKSTLLQHLMENPDVKIISDDMPLCDLNGRIYPFPSKISLDKIPDSGLLSKLEWHEFKRHSYPTKWTASLAQLKERINNHPGENRNVLMAGFRLSKGQSLLTEVPKWKMIKPMMEHMVFGLGLPQIIEIFLRFRMSDLVKLPYHAAIRSVCAFNLVRKAKCYHFYLGPDKSYNAQLLLDLLYESSNS